MNRIPPANSLRRRHGFLAVLVLGLLGVSGCFRPPVVERLALAFLADGRVRVTVAHAVEKPPVKEGAALDERLEETRLALLDGRDEWSRCFASVEAQEEILRWEKRGGNLMRHERSAVLAGSADLREFFARTALRTAYKERDGMAEFAVFPGPASRATREQREQVASAMEEWGGAVAAYLAEGVPLFAYLQEAPDRAGPCFGKLFGSLLDDETLEALPALTAGEEERLQRVEEAMGGVLSALQVREGEAYTLDELSQMAFSPFPSEFIVEATAPFMEVEGFERTGERTVRVPALGLWGAYTAVRGRWLSPDPLQAYLEASLRQGEGQVIDLEAFCAFPRSAATLPPGAEEVLAALRQAITPAEAYRITWLVPENEEEPSMPRP